MNSSLADPNPWPLTESPWPVILILVAYIAFVLKYGKIYMKNRQPYNLRRVLYVYNIGQVIYNGVYFAIVSIKSNILNSFYYLQSRLQIFYYLVIVGICNWHCMEPFPIGHERKNLERYMHMAYFINKILDLLDTVFFVLRKSYKQITVLHVYHHLMMVIGCYLVSRFYGTGGHVNSLGLVNSFVHSVMYFYYFLSALYPGIKASIWWKKYITITQLVQFVILFIYANYVMFFSKGCGYPKFLLIVQILQAVIMMYMFGNFYLKTYIRPVQRKKQG